jgi:hypothetical protein
MNSAVEVCHGYTLDDVDRYARASVNVAYARSMDYTDRYEAAWHAIAELLCTAKERPTGLELKAAGVRAVETVCRDDWRHRGINHRDPEAGRPRFERYWALSRATPSPEETIVDRLALQQIWPTLTATHQQVLLAFALHADHEVAASAIGRIPATYRVHLGNARRAYRKLWHEHETPSVMWSQSRSHVGSRPATVTARERHRRRARLAATKEIA